MCHVNFLADMKPSLLPGGHFAARHLPAGLGKLAIAKVSKKPLNPLFLMHLWHLPSMKPLHICILMQTALGLRAGHLAILTANQFGSETVMLPAFKFQKPVLMPLLHVPDQLLAMFLDLASGRSKDAPIIPFTAAQYKKQFGKLLKQQGFSQTSHSSRHAFGSIHAAMMTSHPTIARYLVHTKEKTTKVYIHEFPLSELQCIRTHPSYFLPLSLVHQPTLQPPIVYKAAPPKLV